MKLNFKRKTKPFPGSRFRRTRGLLRALGIGTMSALLLVASLNCAKRISKKEMELACGKKPRIFELEQGKEIKIYKYTFIFKGPCSSGKADIVFVKELNKTFEVELGSNFRIPDERIRVVLSLTVIERSISGKKLEVCGILL